jgi:hypothetical protein
MSALFDEDFFRIEFSTLYLSVFVPLSELPPSELVFLLFVSKASLKASNKSLDFEFLAFSLPLEKVEPDLAEIIWLREF